jgi:hypothetical protein
MLSFKSLGFSLLALAALSACKKADADISPAARGRFVGVGIFQPGSPWAHLATVPATSDPAAAKLADDQAIIVVTDSTTGEIRACGDLSGYCVGMNPWRAGLTNRQLSPVRLTRHAKTPELDEAAANAAADAVTNAVAPADRRTNR